ncbi:MAG TPA: AsmA-like C-terminal region-containing protein [Terracidiphilus sp.]|nr:AsmA-like C-terminal region-containing protein [Terracidiphilus sp.]
MTQTVPSFWRRHRVFKWTLIAASSLFVVLFIMFAVVARRAEPFLRERVISGLAERFHARVELDNFKVVLGNSLHGEWGLWAEGKGLRIWPPQKAVNSPGLLISSNEPLIRLRSFRFHIPLRLHIAWPLHISSVRLAGLSVHIPPRAHATEIPKKQLSRPTLLAAASIFGRVQIDRVLCTDTDLVIEPGKPGKVPLRFAIAHLTLDSIASDGSMHFQAELTNPRPPGVIQSSGIFGPWVVDDPGASSVAGTYSFHNADLSVFHGIAGILSSTGSYRGILRELVVDGEANVPDFRLTRANNPMQLHTLYHAIVDGTNGDTRLEPVNATLGHSSFVARGTIIGVHTSESTDHIPGHDIALTVGGANTHVEDFLRLATNGSKPLLTGDLAFNASLHIPPGDSDVQKRLELQGHFNLDHVEFTNDKMQGRVRELSLRAQGHPGQAKSEKNDPAPNNPVQSSMNGNFTMQQGIITLPNLVYAVPGADIHLHGTYAIDSGAIDFNGKARMKATVSQMVGGWKGLLLKAADPFFKKDGAGAEFPIHVGGTRDNPDFGLDLNGMKSTSPQSPGGSSQTHPQSPLQH